MLWYENQRIKKQISVTYPQGGCPRGHLPHKYPRRSPFFYVLISYHIIHDSIQNDHHFTQMNPKILAHHPQNLIHKLQTIVLAYPLPLEHLHYFPQLCYQLCQYKLQHIKKKNVKKNPETPIGAK